MNISLNWLSDYVPVDLPAERLGELFTSIGLNLEGIVEAGEDLVFDLEVTSNRPDWLGHLGVARELAAATGQPFTPPQIALPEPVGRAEELTAVDLQCPDLCSRYTARVIRNVQVGPSPDWLVRRLEAVGMRSINNVVDVTNYVLMEYSQPLHSFDLDALAEQRIVVRRARKGETLISIDETTCELTEAMCVIADAEKPVALAGVMGGLNTEVTKATTNVLLESARFDPLTTRRTSRALGILSESNYRFERGVDPVAVDEASRRACQLICDLAGGDLAEGVVDAWPEPWQPTTVTLRPQRTNLLLGIDIPADRQADILDRLGLDPKPDGEVLRCTPPPFRADLTREADLIEEVARIHGYGQIPTLDHVTHRVTAMGRTERVRRKAVETLVAAGYSEAVTFSFVDDAEAALFGWDKPVRVDPNVRRTNNALRPSLAPSLLRAVKTNQDAGNESVSLFELAAVFPPDPAGGELPNEFLQLGLVSTAGLRDVRGAVQALAERLLPEGAVDVRQTDGPLNVLQLAGRDAGHIGTVGPGPAEDIWKHFGLEKPLAVATLDFRILLDGAQLIRTASTLPKFPPIRRDLSLIVAEPLTWSELLGALREIDQPLRVGEEYVTTYRGKPIPRGKKSVTVALEYRSDTGTLTHEEVDARVKELLDHLAEKLQAELRQA